MNKELRDKIIRAVEPEGSTTDDTFEVHTLSNNEPDIECIHLTDRAVDALYQLVVESQIKFASDIKYKSFKSYNEGDYWCEYCHMELFDTDQECACDIIGKKLLAELSPKPPKEDK